MTSEVSSVGTTATGTSSGSTGSTSLTSDFDTFIKLLTAQATHQDPLEPMDGTEYASQLAEFSMVEQQVLTNDNLSVVHQQLNLGNMASLTGWVGMEVRAATSAQFDGSTPIVVAPNPAASSDDVTLVVRDEAGDEVNRITLPVSADPYEWDGTNFEGDTMAAGAYSFVVESMMNGEVIMSEVAEVYVDVHETQMQGSEVILITETGNPILATSVTALRDPNAEGEEEIAT